MKLLRTLFLAACLFIFTQHSLFAGTVDYASLNPSSAALQTGSVQSMAFSATNNKSFKIKTYHAEFLYTKGLTISNITTNPAAAKASIDTKKRLIIFEWSNISQGTTLNASLNVSSKSQGTYTISPSKMYYVDYNKKTYNGSCNSSQIIVQSDTRCTISGTVTDSYTGLPLPGVTVSVTDSLNASLTATTSENGIYVVSGLAYGTVACTFTKVGYFSQTVNKTLSAGQTLILNVQLLPDGMPYEIIRPTDAYNPESWINPALGYDGNINTYTYKQSPGVSPSISFGGSSSNESISAWQNKSLYWHTAWLLVTFDIQAANNLDDLIEIVITDRNGNIKQTIVPITVGEYLWTKNEVAKKLYMGDWGDGFQDIANLRVRVNGYRKNGADGAELKIYDVRIVGDPSSPAVKDYTRGAYISLPGNDNNLITDYKPDELTDVEIDDGDKVSQDGSENEYMIHQFKQKNPFSNVTITWNGQISNSGIEAFAQSFKPNNSGLLTKVGIFFEKSGSPNGSLRVRLKSEIGGEVLAESNSLSELALNVQGSWKTFTFTNPAYVTAGNTYYIEIWRDNFNPVNYPEVTIRSCAIEASTWFRSGGDWFAGGSRAILFEVFINNVVDITSRSCSVPTLADRRIEGLDWEDIFLEAYDRKTSSWVTLATKLYTGETSDMNLVGRFPSDDYSDSNGWIAVRAHSLNNIAGSLATDSINIAEGSGEIAIDIPTIDFGTIEIGKSLFMSFSVSNIGAGDLSIGTISAPSAPFSILSDECSGRTLSTATSCSVTLKFNPASEGICKDMLKIPSDDPANPIATIALNGKAITSNILTGIVTDSSTGLLLSNVTVTVTDPRGTHSSTTDSNGIYSIKGLSQGSFTATFEKQRYIQQTVSGTISDNQTLELNIYLNPIPPLTIAITFPQDSAIVYSSKATILGNVNNNAQVIVNNFGASVTSDNTFSVLIPLNEGQNTVTATATDLYGQTASQSIRITYLKDGILTGTVTDASTHLPLQTYVVARDSVTAKSIGSDPQGMFTMSIRPGPFQVTVTKDGYTTYTFSGTMPPGQTLTLDISMNPILPVISNITVTDITADSATITWTTDEAASSTVEYGTTEAYGNPVTDPVFLTNHSITITGLNPSTAYHFKVASRNVYGFSSLSGDNSFVTQNHIAITITSPAGAEVLSKPDTSITGTISNTAGNETGVTVNGVPATVYGDRFVVNHVPLAGGSNTITANATDTAGNTASTSRTVMCVLGNYIRLTSNIESGIAPLEVTLRIDSSFGFHESSINVTGPALPELLDSTADEYRMRMTEEGIYYFTSSVTGPDGSVYQDTSAIIVMNKTDLDNLLRAKWVSMKNSLSTQDLEKALSFMSSHAQASYQEMFNALRDQLPSILSTQRELNLISIKNKVARYELVTSENGKIYSYEVLFINDTNGLWMIKDF